MLTVVLTYVCIQSRGKMLMFVLNPLRHIATANNNNTLIIFLKRSANKWVAIVYNTRWPGHSLGGSSWKCWRHLLQRPFFQADLPDSQNPIGSIGRSIHAVALSCLPLSRINDHLLWDSSEIRAGCQNMKVSHLSDEYLSVSFISHFREMSTSLWGDT